MSQLFLASLLPLLLLLPISATATDEVLLSKLQNLEKCCNATDSLMLTFVNTINDLTKRLDRLTSCEENCNIKAFQDCSDVRASGRSASGVYKINIGNAPNQTVVDVFCDLKSPDRSWLVFQRRQDGSENFERTWKEYANGFGNLEREFWLGNNALHRLTSTKKYKLRVELEDFEGQKRFAEFANFSIAAASDSYRLNISGYSGDAGDALSIARGLQFSTKDADNDKWAIGSCAQTFHGGWWYNTCHQANLNGPYLRGNHSSYGDGIDWYWFRGYYYSLKATEMKIALVN